MSKAHIAQWASELRPSNRLSESSWSTPPPILRRADSLSITASGGTETSGSWQHQSETHTPSGKPVKNRRNHGENTSNAPKSIKRGADQMLFSVRVCPKSFSRFGADATSSGGGEAGSGEDSGVLTVSQDQRKIYCPENELSDVSPFDFDLVFPPVPTADVFKEIVSPLVPHIARGGRATIVVDGPMVRAKAFTVEGSLEGGNLGLLQVVAEKLLLQLGTWHRQANLPEDFSLNSSVLTLSWCRLVGRWGVEDLVGDAMDHDTDMEAPGIVDDANTGVNCHGLIEVAVTSTGDVTKFLRGVRSSVGYRNHQDRSHDVYSLHVKPYGGRLDFISLGSAQDTARSSGRACWSEDVLRACKNLQNDASKKLVSNDVFSQSAILLMLRSALMGRMPAVWLSCVSSNIDDVSETLVTLQNATTIREALSGYSMGKLHRAPSRKPPGVPSNIAVKAADTPLPLNGSAINLEDSGTSAVRRGSRGMIAEILAREGAGLDEWFAELLRVHDAQEKQIKELKSTIEKERHLERKKDCDEEKQREEQGDVVRLLRSELKNVKSELSDLEMYRSVMEATIARLNNDVGKLAEERDRARVSLQRLRAQKHTRQAQASARKISDLRSEISSRDKVIGGLRSRLAGLEKAYASAKAAASKKQQASLELESLRQSGQVADMLIEETARLTRALEAKNASEEYAKAQLSKSRALNTKLKANETRLLERVEELQRKVGKLEASGEGRRLGRKASDVQYTHGGTKRSGSNRVSSKAREASRSIDEDSEADMEVKIFPEPMTSRKLEQSSEPSTDSMAVLQRLRERRLRAQEFMNRRERSKSTDAAKLEGENRYIDAKTLRGQKSRKTDNNVLHQENSHRHDYVRENAAHGRNPDVQHAHAVVDDHADASALRRMKGTKHDYVRENAAHGRNPDIRHAHAVVDDHINASALQKMKGTQHDYIRENASRGRTPDISSAHAFVDDHVAAEVERQLKARRREGEGAKKKRSKSKRSSRK